MNFKCILLITEKETKGRQSHGNKCLYYNLSSEKVISCLHLFIATPRESSGARLCVNAASNCQKAHYFLPRVPLSRVIFYRLCHSNKYKNNKSNRENRRMSYLEITETLFTTERRHYFAPPPNRTALSCSISHQGEL